MSKNQLFSTAAPSKKVSPKKTSCRLLVMTKAPELGRVKTRMQPILSQQQSVDLHLALTKYVLSQWLGANLCDVELWVGGDLPLCQKALSLYQYAPELSVYPQSKGDLGERMLDAVSQHFPVGDLPTAQGVILVGTDCPFITGDYLLEAINGLLRHDVVIGPAEDGGYVLLGLTGRYSHLFEGIEWGTDAVFSQTMEKIIELGLDCLQLDYLPDIDMPEDLTLLSNDTFPQELSDFSLLQP